MCVDMASVVEACVLDWEILSTRGRGEVVVALALVETSLVAVALAVRVRGLGRASLHWRQEFRGGGLVLRVAWEC